MAFIRVPIHTVILLLRNRTSVLLPLIIYVFLYVKAVGSSTKRTYEGVDTSFSTLSITLSRFTLFSTKRKCEKLNYTRVFSSGTTAHTFKLLRPIPHLVTPTHPRIRYEPIHFFSFKPRTIYLLCLTLQYLSCVVIFMNNNLVSVQEKNRKRACRCSLFGSLPPVL